LGDLGLALGGAHIVNREVHDVVPWIRHMVSPEHQDLRARGGLGG